MSDNFQLDPAPEEWLSSARIDKLRSDLGDAIHIMSNAGVLPGLELLIRQNLARRKNPSAAISWAHIQWGYRLDSLFLQRKDWLDEAVVNCYV